MIDTGFMFAGTKTVEVVTGLMLLVNLWVPLALVVAFPVTVGIWSVDFFLISQSPRAQLLGWSVLTLNTYLLFAYRCYFVPMLVARTTPWAAEVDGARTGPNAGWPFWWKQALLILGVVAVALGGIASGWLIVMVVRQFSG